MQDWFDFYKKEIGKNLEIVKDSTIIHGGIDNYGTYFYNVKTGNRISLNGNIIYEFQTLDVFRIIKKRLSENPAQDDIRIGIDSLASVSEAVFNKKLWELKEDLFYPLSLPPSSRALLIHCTPCSVVRTVFPLGRNIDSFPVKDPIIYLVMLHSHHLHATAFPWV